MNKHLLNALRASGYTQQFNEALRAFLASEGYTGHINKAFKDYLGAQGYTGTYTKRLSDWTRDGGTLSPAVSSLPVSDARGFRGYFATTYNTTGDLYVSESEGNDGNAGTSIGSPKATINAAIAAATAGDVILVAGGKYREQVVIDKAITLRAYGNQMPWITGADLLTGFVQCSSPTDDAVLGSTLAATGSVYKTTVAKSTINHVGYFAGLNLHEDGQRMYLISDRDDTSLLKYPSYTETFHLADGVGNGFGVDVDDKVITITDDQVITAAKYSDAELVGKRVLLKNYPNQVKGDVITSSDVATNTITISGAWTVQGADDAGTWVPDTDSYLYTIENSRGDDLIAGTYFVVEDGTDLDIYIRPTNAANIEAIEYSTRPLCIEIGDAINNVLIEGFRISQAAGAILTATEGVGVYKDATASATALQTNIVINNCFLHGFVNSDVNSPGTAKAVAINGVSQSKVVSCTAWDIPGQGFTINGRADDSGELNLIDMCHVQETAYDAVSCFWNNKLAVSHLLMDTVGFDTHSSSLKLYGTSGAENNNDLLYWGIESVDANGKVQWQRTSGPVVAFSWIPRYFIEGATPEITLWNGNDSAGNQAPVINTSGYIFNCTFPPMLGSTYDGYHVSMARATGDNGMGWTIDNNVVGAMDDPGNFTGSTSIDQMKNNVVYKLSSGASQTAADFTGYDATNVVDVDLDNTFADAATEDYGPATGGHILAKRGVDHSATVTALASVFTQVDSSTWTKDFKNQTIDWADLPIGADAGLTWDRDEPQITSSVVITDVTTTTATATLSVDSILGDVIVAAYASGATPNKADVLAGTGALVTPTTQTITGLTAQAVPLTGLPSGTDIEVHAVRDDGFLTGDVVKSAEFTTQALSPNLIADGGFDDAAQWVTTDANITVDAGGNSLLTIAAPANFTECRQANSARPTVSSSTNYTVSIDGVTVTSGGRFRLYVDQYTAGGASYLGLFQIYDTAVGGNITTGGQVITNFTTEPTCEMIRLKIENVSGTNATFDNFYCGLT